MIKYVKIFCDISETVDVLSDAEAGRLLKSLLHYGMDGTVDQLPGQEKLVFHMLKAQIDRDRESYDQKSQRNRENGAKGGRPKKPKETQQNPVGFEITQQNPQEPTKRQDKDKDIYIPPYNPPKGDVEAEEEALIAQSALLDEVFDKAKRSGFPQNDASRDMFVGCLHKYGKDVLFFAIDECVKSQVINFRYLEKVLENKKAEAKTKAVSYETFF